MIDEILNFGIEHANPSIIKVIGVGGGGCNAVKHMFEEGIVGVDFIICNTDAQAMQNNPVPIRIQLGVTLTEGRGAGNLPEQGEQAAIENLDDIRNVLEGTTKMVFITAGMGGGTGTGAAPVIAQLARELGILTIAVVTLPSPSEGKRRYEQARAGIDKLKEHVDSMLVISNEKLHKIYGNLTASVAFKKADNIITTAVKGVAEIITLHGNINIDFADVCTVMAGSEVFIMGTGFATGEGRAMKSVQQALESPLLDSSSIKGTKDILLNIISGTQEITMGEIGEIIDYLQEAAGQDATIIWGNGIDLRLGDQISVTIIATGFDVNPNRIFQRPADIIELRLDEDGLEINLEDEQPLKGAESAIPKSEILKENQKKPLQEEKSGKRTTRRKSELVGETNQEDTNSWFSRMFSKKAESKDSSEADEMP
jgi:cell division protein FtsZ